MENEILLSIIIPVFNVEKYISTCINSVITGNMNNVEIILIDDGSTDSSSYICDQFSEKYSFIIVKHIANHGVAYARNIGLDIAKGKWISWIDGDDMVFPNFVNVIKTLITLDLADIYKFNYKIINKEVTLSLDNIEFNKNSLLEESKEKVMAELPASIYGNYLWCRVFKRSLFNELRFPEGNNCEDAFLMVEILERAHKFYFYNSDLYCHFYHQNTITTSKNKIKQSLQLKDWLASNVRLTNKLQEYGYLKAYELSKTQLLNISYFIVNKIDFENVPDTGIYSEANKILEDYKDFIGNTTSIKFRFKLLVRHKYRFLYNFIMNIKNI